MYVSGWFFPSFGCQQIRKRKKKKKERERDVVRGFQLCKFPSHRLSAWTERLQIGIGWDSCPRTGLSLGEQTLWEVVISEKRIELVTPWYLLPLVRIVLDQSLFPWWWTVTGYLLSFFIYLLRGKIQNFMWLTFRRRSFVGFRASVFSSFKMSVLERIVHHLGFFWSSSRCCNLQKLCGVCVLSVFQHECVNLKSFACAMEDR